MVTTALFVSHPNASVLQAVHEPPPVSAREIEVFVASRSIGSLKVTTNAAETSTGFVPARGGTDDMTVGGVASIRKSPLNRFPSRPVESCAGTLITAAAASGFGTGIVP